MSLEYIIISDSGQALKKSLVFKITDPEQPSQLEKITLFTSDKFVLDQLLQDGYIHGSSLTALLLAHFGQKRIEEQSLKNNLSQQLSLLHQRYKTLRESLISSSFDPAAKPSEFKEIKKELTRLTNLIYEFDQAKKIASYNNDILSKIQTEIISLRIQETTVAFDNVNQQIAFKKKLSALLQNHILSSKLYYCSLQPGRFEYFLMQSIDLLYAYTFPKPSLTKDGNFFTCYDQIPFSDCSAKPYFIVPDGLDSRKKIQQFYQNYAYLLNHNLGIVKAETEAGIDLDKISYSRNTFNSIFSYIIKYKARAAIFIILGLLEIFFLPIISTFFQSIYLLNLLGFGNKFVILGFALPSTITLINFVFDLPHNLKILVDKFKVLLKNLIKIFKSTRKISTPDKLDDRACFEEYFQQHENLYFNHLHTDFHQQQSFVKSPNLIWRLPFLHSIITYLQKEYRRYSNWYFSYIHRNPLGFTMYLIIRIIAIFTKLVHYPLSTYFGIEQAADRALSAEKLETIFVNPKHYLSTPESKAVRKKLSHDDYVILYKTLDGDFICYKYNNYETVFIKKISLAELQYSLSENRLDIKKNPLFYYSSTDQWLSSSDIKNKILYDNIFSTNQVFVVPSALIKPSSFLEQIYNAFQCSFLIIFTKQFIIDAAKTICIRIPLFFCKLLINNIIISGLYLIIFLLCNIFLKIFNFLNFVTLRQKIIIFESKLFQFYYNFYYTIASYLDVIGTVVDQLESKEFKISRTLADLDDRTSIELSWMRKAAPEIYLKLKNIEAYLSTYNEEKPNPAFRLPLANILTNCQQLLNLFYELASAHPAEQEMPCSLLKLTHKLTILDKYIDILNYYRANKTIFLNPKDHKIEFIFGILKIQALFYMISHPEYSLKIYKILESCDKIKNNLTEKPDKIFSNLVTELYHLSNHPIISQNIKAQILQPTIDQLAIIYGSEASALMTRLRSIQEVTPIKRIQLLDDVPMPRRRASL